MKKNKFIIGAGLTGLACGSVSGFPIFEAEVFPGGICTSYYMQPKDSSRLMHNPADNGAYRFEIGGGHWIFGGDTNSLSFIRDFVSLNSHTRRSSIFFQNKNLFVPYPIQYHLRFLDKHIASQIQEEMATSRGEYKTMKGWLTHFFGPTLCDLFFFPFHELYTAGLYNRIAPQNAFKSPFELSLVREGASCEISQVGYNASFFYPDEGLNTLVKRIAGNCDIKYGKRVVKIELSSRKISFDDSSSTTFDALISTLPLNKIIEMTEIQLKAEIDPYTSVLVLNIGARRGDQCPDDHWIYTPDSRSGFHRVGFYSNVENSFLPVSSRINRDRVGIYVERAYLGGEKPTDNEISEYIEKVVKELQAWGFIKEVEVADPTWIDVAYTWTWPDSNWKQLALKELEKFDIYQVGRYGRWEFQGIADSIRDGLMVGSAMKCNQKK